MNAAVGKDWEGVAQVYELQQQLDSKLRWWQNLRIERCPTGINAYVELKPELDFIPMLLGFKVRRAILSYLPEGGRLGSFCVMIDGVESSRQWLQDAEAAIKKLIELV